MLYFHEFNIKLWENLGFRFSDDNNYDGLTKRGRARYRPWDFGLQIHEITIASIDNPESGEFKHHAVSEIEAIRWFCKVSTEFKDKYNSLQGILPNKL